MIDVLYIVRGGDIIHGLFLAHVIAPIPVVWFQEGGDPEKQKVHQKLKAREWDELMAKKKVKVLEAVVRGCVWEGEGPPLELFQQFAVCLVEPLPKPEPITPEDYAQKLQQKLQEDEQREYILMPGGTSCR